MAIKPFEINYDYSDAPTLYRFAMDNNPFRCVKGPVGCLSAGTEFLTRSGWVKISEYQAGTEVGEFNPKTKKLEFRLPKSYIKEECSEFHYFRSRSLEMQLSPEHTVIFDTRHAPEKFQVISALELFNQHNFLKDGFSGRIPNVWDAADREGVALTNNELRLMVAICADGSFHPKSASNRAHICIRKDRKKERLVRLLEDCGIKYEIFKHVSRPAEWVYSFIAPLKTKTLTSFWAANKDQLGIIAEEVTYWDGFRSTRDVERRYYTTKKEDADFVQYALASIGRKASISTIQYEKKNWKTGYIVHFGEGSNHPYVSLRQSPKAEMVSSSDGYKYCFTTTTGFFVARLNNKIFVTGNSGKTSAMIQEIIRRGLAQRPGRDGIRRTKWAVVRNTYPRLKDTTIRSFHDWYPPVIQLPGGTYQEGFGTYNITDHNYKITAFPNCEIEILFRALDRPEQEQELRSLEVTGFWFNEAAEIPLKIFEAAQERIGRFPSRKSFSSDPKDRGKPYFLEEWEDAATWKGIIMDTNPPSTRHWIYKRFKEEQLPYHALFEQPGGVSPQAENLRNLPRDYYTVGMAGKTPEHIRVMRDGEWGEIQSGKAIYEYEFKYDTHVAKERLEPNPYKPLLIGMDFGLNCSAVIGQIDAIGQLRILEEVPTDVGIQTFMSDYFLPLMNGKYFGYNVTIIGDPAGNDKTQNSDKTCYDYLREAGFYVEPSWTNEPIARIEAVKTKLISMTGGEPAFQIDKGCTMLVAGFVSEYKRRKLMTAGDERYTEYPDKNDYSHIHDALQYLCTYLQGQAKSQKRKERQPVIRIKKPSNRAWS